MKKKLAKILRRWASKLSPETDPLRFNSPTTPWPSFESQPVKKFQGAHIYTPRTLRDIERDPKFAAVVEMETRQDLIKGLALSLYQAGAITFRTEERTEGRRIIATCYAAVKEQNKEPETWKN